jgi:RimJ/RimL family protein N-acetyltransferase
MMVNKLIIIPYKQDHGKLIMQSQMNHMLTQKDASFIISDNNKECMNLEQEHLAFTGLINDKVIAAAGMKRIWGNVAEGWFIGKKEVWNYPITIAKAVKQNIDYLATSNNIKRLQTAVRADFEIGIRFAKWLGFTNEGLMKNYGFDDTDHYRFARIY